jgi:hypothetical protein
MVVREHRDHPQSNVSRRLSVQPLSFWLSSPKGICCLPLSLGCHPADDSHSHQNHSPAPASLIGSISLNSHPKRPSILLHPPVLSCQATSSFVSSPTMLVRPKIKLKFVAYFFAAKISRLLHHVYHADHHVLTIKKPPPKTRIPQTPLKKLKQIHQSQDPHHDQKKLRLNSYSGK